MTIAQGRPLVIAHRGGSSGAHENSLEAFEIAIDAGSDMIEFDLRRTLDDQLIAYHDADVAGTPVRELSYSEVSQRLDFRPPLVDEILELARGRIKLDVELKEAGSVDRVLSALRDRVTREEFMITSFLAEVVERVKAVAPETRAGLILGADKPKHVGQTRLADLYPVKRARRCGADYVVLHHKLARFGAVKRAASAGVPVLVWTLNEDAQLRRFLADERVHAVITDIPERALRLRDELHAPT